MSIHSDYMFIISPKGYVPLDNSGRSARRVSGQESTETELLSSYTIRACRNSSLIRE